jgi:hypothetical protein
MTNYVFSGVTDHAGRAYAVVLDSAQHGDSLVTTIRVSLWPGDPITPAALWDIEGKSEVLQFHRLIDTEGSQLTLETFDFRGELPVFDHEYLFQLWWTPDAMDLVTDMSRVWRRSQYPEGDKCDWCPLTYKDFGQDREREGYFSDGVWITVAAYNKYIRDDFLRVRHLRKEIT